MQQVLFGLLKGNNHVPVKQINADPDYQDTGQGRSCEKLVVGGQQGQIP